MSKVLLLTSSLTQGAAFFFLASIAFVGDVPTSSAVGLGSAAGAGTALLWLLGKTIPDREATFRETTRAHREGLRDISLSLDQLKSEVVTQLREDSHRISAQLQTKSTCSSSGCPGATYLA